MKRMGDVLSTLFDEGLMKKAKNYSAFFSCWNDLMEKNNIPAAADHSRLKNLEKGVVWVEVDHPGWKQILQTKQSKLLSDFRYRFPDLNISGLSISLCKTFSVTGEKENKLTAKPVQNRKADNLPEKGPPEAVSETGIQNHASGYDGIKDEALKETLLRLEKSVNEKAACGVV